MTTPKTIPDFRETLIGMNSRVQQIMPVTQPRPEHLKQLNDYFRGILQDVYRVSYGDGFKQGELEGHTAGYDRARKDLEGTGVKLVDEADRKPDAEDMANVSG